MFFRRKATRSTPTLQDEGGNGKGGSERTPPARARFVVPATYDVFEVVKDTGFLDTSLPLAARTRCGHGRRACGRGACRTCARQHPDACRDGGQWHQKRGKMAPCGLGLALCHSSDASPPAGRTRLGTSVFATSSARARAALSGEPLRPPRLPGVGEPRRGGRRLSGESQSVRLTGHVLATWGVRKLGW